MCPETSSEVYPLWWVLDSTACCHMARDKLDFTEYTLLDEPVEFRTAGDYSIEATGEGTISVAFSSGDWTLRRVYHVPGPPWNVMSVHVLASNGFFVWFGETSASVLDKEATGVVEEASLVETEKVYVMNRHTASRPSYEC